MRIVEQSAGNAGGTRSIASQLRICGERLGARLGERLLPRRSLVAHRARDQPRHRVHNYRCAQFATAQHIVANRNFAIRQVLADAFVHAFVASADEDDPVERRKFRRQRLIEPASLRGKQNHRLLRARA